MTSALWSDLEPIYTAKFRAELIRLVRKSANDPIKVKITNDDLIDDPLANKFVVEFMALFDKSARKARLSFGQKTADTWDIQSQAVYKQIREHAIKLVQSTIADIQAETEAEANRIIDEFRTELLEGQKRGETLKSKVNRLARYFGEQARWKARRIAITEASRGVNYGYLAATADLDVVVGYEWLLSDDACDWCKSVGMVNGKPRKVKKGQPFATGQSNDDYYSTIYAAPLHPSCRCTLVGVLDTDQPKDWDHTVSAPGH